VWVDGHGRHPGPGTYFQGWTPSGHFLGQRIHCGQLILRKISKIGATRCQILRLKYTKFDLPQIPLGELTALPRPPSCIERGLLLKGRRGKGRDRGKKGEGGLPSGGGEGRGEGQGKLELGRPGTSSIAEASSTRTVCSLVLLFSTLSTAVTCFQSQLPSHVALHYRLSRLISSDMRELYATQRNVPQRTAMKTMRVAGNWALVYYLELNRKLWSKTQKESLKIWQNSQ